MVGPVWHASWRRCALAVSALLLSTASATGQPLVERLLADARGGQLDKLDFVAAALIAGGVADECELSGWIDSYLERRAAVLNAIPVGPAAERLQAIHAAFRGQILTGAYQTRASDLRLTLSHGDYNCLSSLAVYFDLCQAAGLDVKIWLERGHVHLRFVERGGAAINIEPGLRQWAGQSRLRVALARQITPVELLGKFYYNRGVELLREHRFGEGLQLLQISLALDPRDSDARANMAAGLNNWAVERCRVERFGEAAALIKRGLALDPSFAPLIANERLVREKLRQ
jgi:tetratricopeptide (TPR) repeat protein